jgi:hypothetical protein
VRENLLYRIFSGPNLPIRPIQSSASKHRIYSGLGGRVSGGPDIASGRSDIFYRDQACPQVELKYLADVLDCLPQSQCRRFQPTGTKGESGTIAAEDEWEVGTVPGVPERSDCGCAREIDVLVATRSHCRGRVNDIRYSDHPLVRQRLADRRVKQGSEVNICAVMCFGLPDLSRRGWWLNLISVGSACPMRADPREHAQTRLVTTLTLPCVALE